VVIRTEIRDSAGDLICLSGAVAVILRLLSSDPEIYPVRLANGICYTSSACC
jgi:hypothetical protein